MSRPKLKLQNEFPYHVTARCLNREWFKLDLDLVWDIFSRQLTFVTWAFDARVHSFVMMTNHIHLLISTPLCNLDHIMGNFMKETTWFMNRQSGRVNQAWGAPHFRNVIASQHYFLTAYKYVYRNPVEAGLSRGCEAYKYSSLHFLLGQSRATFPVVEDTTLFSDVAGTLIWLNRRPPIQDRKDVEWAMKQSLFRLPRDRNSKKQNHLELDLF